jgi:hypothetical protein
LSKIASELLKTIGAFLFERSGIETAAEFHLRRHASGLMIDAGEKKIIFGRANITQTSTAYRVMGVLEENGILAKSGKSYVVTPFGADLLADISKV